MSNVSSRGPNEVDKDKSSTTSLLCADIQENDDELSDSEENMLDSEDENNVEREHLMEGSTSGEKASELSETEDQKVVCGRISTRGEAGDAEFVQWKKRNTRRAVLLLIAEQKVTLMLLSSHRLQWMMFLIKPSPPQQKSSTAANSRAEGDSDASLQSQTPMDDVSDQTKSAQQIVRQRQNENEVFVPKLRRTKSVIINFP
ncbi:histone-lysine N-methyltransferase ash1-like isoform X1 [Labeo rohita]|nr:histone-lysine N-methyltransferase ash1-like isoform X1 [Labeo rohita]